MGKKNESKYKCPAGLLGLVVVFWGWQANVWLLGVFMAGILEIPRWLPMRIKITDAQFVWVSNISSLVLLICGIVFFTTNLEQSIFLVAKWLPLVLFLLLVAQLYSDSRLIPLQAIMVSMRGSKVSG